MKRVFLLDENLVARAILGRSRTPLELWLTIARNCHRLVVSPLLEGKYWEKVREARTRVAPEIATNLVAIMNGMLRSQDKSIWVEPVQTDPRSHRVRDPDDWFLEDIALDAVTGGQTDHCILVTVDEATRRDFNRSGLRAAGIEGLTIEQGLARASVKDG